MLHVDDFIDDPESDMYAARWFALFRRPADMKADKPNHNKLFTTYLYKKYRVVGCSTFGDVWLTSDFNEDTRYELRVDVDMCGDWSRE